MNRIAANKCHFTAFGIRHELTFVAMNINVNTTNNTPIDTSTCTARDAKRVKIVWVQYPLLLFGWKSTFASALLCKHHRTLLTVYQNCLTIFGCSWWCGGNKKPKFDKWINIRHIHCLCNASCLLSHFNSFSIHSPNSISDFILLSSTDCIDSTEKIEWRNNNTTRNNSNYDAK